MAARRPLVIVEGRVHELPVGDSLPVDATGTTPDTGTPLRLLGYDAAGNLHEVSIGAGLAMVSGLLSAAGGGSGGSGLDGGFAAAVYLPAQSADGGDAGTTSFASMYDGGVATTVNSDQHDLDGGGAAT